MSLDELQKRIEQTDLVPSRAPLLDGIGAKVDAIKQHGITTLAGLRKELRNAGRLLALSKATGIAEQYLILFRREIEGYFPKPSALTAFDWLPESDVHKLERKGIPHTAALYEVAFSTESRTELAKSSRVDGDTLETLVRLADLTRVQWVSPTFARMLATAGYDAASKVAAADAENLYEALARVNEGNRFFKGKISLRDVKRLVRAASFVPD